ncbi:MAG: hypothetical protein R6V06_00075 [Kiritimatiellia bacterium]
MAKTKKDEQKAPAAIPPITDDMTEGQKRRAIARAKRYAKQA